MSDRTQYTDIEEMHDAFTHSFFAMFQKPGASESKSEPAKAGSASARKTY